jgi:hypothetical protein
MIIKFFLMKKIKVGFKFFVERYILHVQLTKTTQPNQSKYPSILMHPQAPYGFNYESKGDNNGKRSWARSLPHSISGVERRAQATGWGLERLTSKSIIHMDLHKLNNKLVSAQLEHLWCTNESRANKDSQDSSWPRLEGSHHLPPYSIF